MINITERRKCLFDGCKKQPVFNYEGETKGIYCATHKELNMIDDVRRINKLKYNTLSGNPSNTTIIHGDYVDDRDTLVKDSVLNRSNVGSSGKSKVEELEKVSGLKEKGLINNEEYEQMKKEILGK